MKSASLYRNADSDDNETKLLIKENMFSCFTNMSETETTNSGHEVRLCN